jgi:hypothetical protein
MTKETKPHNLLILSKRDLALLKHWPLELRALYDPEAEQELYRQESQAREDAEKRWAQLGEEIPY